MKDRLVYLTPNSSECFGSSAVAGMAAALNFEYFGYFIINAFAQTAITFGTLLQFASYAIPVERSNRRNRQKLKPKFQTQYELMRDEVYVKLLERI